MPSVSAWMFFGLGIIAALMGFHHYVRSYVKDFIVSSEVIELVSSKIVRPFVVFDTDPRILDTNGAYEKYIEKINLGEPNKFGKPKSIFIETKQWLQTAPLLECLSYNCYAESNRGIGKTWKYNLLSEEAITDSSGEPIKKHVFRLEILK